MMLDLSSLPVLTKGQSAGLNSLRWLLAKIQLSSADGEVQIDGFSECPPLSFDAPAQFVLRCQYGVFVLTLEAACVNAVLDQVVDGWRTEDEAAIPYGWWLIYLVDLFSEQTPLADAQVAIQVGDGDIPDILGGAPALYGQVNCLGQNWPIAVALVETVPGKPIPRPKLDSKAIQDDLPVSVDLSVGRLRLASSKVRAVQQGDLIILGKGPGHGVNARLTLNRHFTWTGTLASDGAFHVQDLSKETPGMDFDDDLPIEIAGTATGDDTDLAAAPMDLSLLPMHLDFQLCRKTLPLHQVSTLAPGAILELGIDLRDPVIIRVNEQPIGAGHLVRIGNRIGLQVDRWNDHTGPIAR